ncbi:two-component system response regulator CreB [bacterium]|nr:two-component system response regulator CreB [bacterium]
MKARILIVDDEPSIVDAIQYALETEGFETACLFSGLPVLATLAEQPADLVVLDIGLPDISGLELCREIRRTSAVPIIFLTARADEIDRVVGLELGADDYITKPFSPREVSARVKAVLRRTGTGGNSAPPRDAVFIINESKRRIWYQGECLDLSRYEYEILKTFIRRPGHVFSREQLMELVWEHPEASLDRTIDAHIKNIRAKLKRVLPESDPIVTHRGTGYCLRDDL